MSQSLFGNADNNIVVAIKNYIEILYSFSALLITIILILMTCIMVNAQIGIYSMSQDRTIPVDTARYKVTYALNYTCHPDVQNRFDDVRTVLIGHRCVKDVSDVICHFDSLMTADMRRGKNTCRNPNGSPWPYEILVSPKEKSGEHQIPSSNWKWSAEIF